MSNPTPSGSSCPACGVSLRSLVPLLLRLSLGSLFVFSGFMKLGLTKAFMVGGMEIAPLDPLDLAYSIRAFELHLPDSLVIFMAHAIPWTELLAGALLVVGLWARSAALLIGTLMVIFIGGILSLLFRGFTNVNCPCFGALGLFCGHQPLGVCHLFRNTGFLAAAAVILWLGPGCLSIDQLLNRRKTCATSAA